MNAPIQKSPVVVDLSNLVTKAYCKQRAWVSKSMFGILFLLMTLFLGLVGYAAKASNSAATYAGEAVNLMQPIADKAATNEKNHQLHVVEFNAQRDMQNQRNDAVLEKLDEIKGELNEQRAEQRKMLEKILTKGTP